MTAALSLRLNAFGLLALAAVLAVAFYDQLVLGDLPCPLCILQRAGFAAAGMGLALNLRFGPKPSHYAIVILSAVAGGAISIRQILLHIVPGTGSYGNAILGLHFYTWAFILAVAIVIGSAAMLLFDRQFEGERDRPLAGFARVVVVLFILLVLGNGVSTVVECAGGLCPDNPTEYLLLKSK
ncbi:MAG: disulfide bond formation protein B [Pseudorhodoplanes sp.]|nr:disulfide bond formation protein B [Pseudorhodoplanes sp.]